MRVIASGELRRPIFVPNAHPSFIHQSIADNTIFMSECFLVGSSTRLKDIRENIKSNHDVGYTARRFF
ncbi:hypothetical protein V1477_001307 [Vespula maculifrons]|uniref:Uncharacterized protein n=1 Tax=Vespula maculifrons TaxID=7453 RepID=A0ABD2CZF7_VESMC